jgi:WD40 repeat protein
VISLACSPDSKYIASGSFDKTVRVWEATTGRQVVIYHGHSDKICSVALSPDGNYVVSASYDKTVQIWEATTGCPVYIYNGHELPVYTVAWSPDGQHIASGDAGGTVKVWSVTLFEDNGQQQKPPVSYVQDTTANHNQRNAVQAWDSQHNAVQAVAWSPDNRYIASVAHNVQVFDSFTKKRIYTYTKHDGGLGQAVQAVAWSPNGKYIASGGMEGSVQVWNARL